MFICEGGGHGKDAVATGRGDIVAAPERKEQDAIREVSLRLAATYARSVPRERVDESVQRAYHRFDGSPVRTYVPLLVEHAVRDELQTA